MGFLSGLFGGSSKQVTKSENNIVNESVFNALTKSTNAQSAKILTVQDMSVSGVTAYCNLDISQKINADIKVLAKFDEKQTQDLVSNMMSDIAKKAKQESQQKTGFMNLIPNSSEKVDQTINNITNKVKKTITAETLNTLSTKIVNNQKLITKNLVIDPLGLSIYKELGIPPPIDLMKEIKNTSCKIGQDAQIKFVSEQIGKKVLEIMNKDESAQKLAAEIDQAAKQESQGVGAAVGEGAEGIGKGVSSIMSGAAMPSAVSAVVSCVCCGALLAFGMSPAGQSLSKNAGGAAMRRF
jgi:hypothetical protein